MLNGLREQDETGNELKKQGIRGRRDLNAYTKKDARRGVNLAKPVLELGWGGEGRGWTGRVWRMAGHAKLISRGTTHCTRQRGNNGQRGLETFAAMGRRGSLLVG